MLKQRMRYKNDAPSQPTPALYGATLKARLAGPFDLPPGCAWIEAGSIESAAQTIHHHMVEGQSSTAIWLPPDRGSYIN